MYVITGVILFFVFLNYYLGYRLYQEPTNQGYFSNIKHYNVVKERYITSSPNYIFSVSVLLGIFFGVYVALNQKLHITPLISWTMVILLMIVYLVEITRKITLTEESLLLEKAFMRRKEIPLNQIDGMYLYSWNKRFLNKKAFTTKLVVVTGNRKHKFTLSGIDVRAVLNMMKENFGINEYKMFIACKESKIME